VFVIGSPPSAFPRTNDENRRIRRVGSPSAGTLLRDGLCEGSDLRLRPRFGIDRPARFVEIPDGGRPDGLTVDSEGGVWVALSNARAVHRYTSRGALDEVIQLPAGKVTACTFGGPNLDQLFITTSREGLEPGMDPLAGSLFRSHVGIRGVPAREFAG
jgi:sugar lactone lactonase YvrE